MWFSWGGVEMHKGIFFNGVLVGQLQRLSNLVFWMGKVNIAVGDEDTGCQAKRMAQLMGTSRWETRPLTSILLALSG